jgi:hypothetical protein
MADFSKLERKALRELAGEVYEAEAGRMLEELASSFDQWRDGKILPSELLDSIHEFHQHQSRQLWSMYQGLRESDIVARGLALDLIADARVAASLLEKLTPYIASYRR